jgi:hypothetical protein
VGGSVAGTDVNNRIKLLLLAGVLVMPTALVFLVYGGLEWRPSPQKNYGELLPSTPVLSTAGAWLDGASTGFERTRGKWVLAYVAPTACEEACRKSLYYMRQARILQDAERHRVELVWVLTEVGDVDAGLLQAVPELQVWQPADAAFNRQFPHEKQGENHIYLIDPLGNLVLRFPSPPDAKRMMKDLKLLLKASQIG